MLNLLVLWFLVATSAGAAVPKRNLLVEFRQVDEQPAGSYATGAPGSAPVSAQSLLILNGEKASFRLHTTSSLQWVQAASTSPGSAADAGTQQPGNTSIAFNSAIVQVEAGQTLTVKPTWAGGVAPAIVEVEIQTSHLQQHATSALPEQVKHVQSTSVQAPLGYWVVIGRIGSLEGGSSSYRAGGQSERRISWQLRVQVP
jgi:hypothetical protein